MKNELFSHDYRINRSSLFMCLTFYGNFGEFDYTPSEMFVVCWSKGLGLGRREVRTPASWESPKKKCKTLLLPKFRVTGHFSKDEDILHVFNASSCFYYQRTLCPGTAANSGLPFLCLIKSIPPPSFVAPPTTLDTGPHLSISVFLCPLLGRWGTKLYWILYTLHFIAFMLL